MLEMLLLAHFLGDYPFQPEFLAINKSKNLHCMIAHCFIYALSVSAVLMIFNEYTLLKLIILLVSHYLTDTWKCKKGHNDKTWLIDQILHMIILIGMLF